MSLRSEDWSRFPDEEVKLEESLPTISGLPGV